MTDLDYAKVMQRLGLTVGDTADPDETPDTIWCDGGTVQIVPLNTYVKVADGSPVPWTGGNAVIECTVTDADYVDPTANGFDGAGYLLFNGKPYVWVVDLASAKVNPTVTTGATHRINYVGMTADGTAVSFPSVDVRITAAGDGISPDGFNDLTILSPVVPGTATPIYRGEPGVSVASAEIVGGTELVFAMTDGSEVSAGELPAATTAIDAADTATTAAGTATTKAGEATAAATDAGSAQAAAETARTDAEAARDDAVAAKVAAEAVGSTNDTIIAGRIADPGSSTSAALTASYAGKSASPRDTQRITTERKPVLALDQLFPNAYTDHRIVWVHGDAILYGIGKDDSLRVSNDSGITWGSKLSYAGGLGVWAKYGGFLRLANGYLLTTYHPYDLSAPKIQRSIDGGGTWSDVVGAQANVDYLGPTSMCQDPVTGYVYATEYVTATAATKATWKIIRSTDNGGTWTTFHTFDRDATTNPTTAVRHGHGIQWDPVSQRIYFMCGDGEQSAGLYRVNGAGTDIEAVVTNAMTGMDNTISPDMVGVMFFPNYIAWGVDRVSDSHLVRMARSEIGDPTPTVEKIARLQSTAFYCIRTKSDNTEWLMTVSQENGGGGRVDNLCHLYRVADDAATLDEVASESVASSTAFSWGVPVGDPLKTHTHNLFWIGSNVASLANKAPGHGGWQASARLGWSSGTALLNPGAAARPFYVPITAASGNQDLAASQEKYFGGTEAPPRTSRLYILEAAITKFSGTGLGYLEVVDWASGSVVGVLKMEDGTTDMQWQNRSRRAALNENTAPYLCRSAALSPGRQIRFRVREVLGGANTAEVGATITYAWGF